MFTKSFWLITVVLVINGLASDLTVIAQPTGSSRDPFVLELPGVTPERLILPIVRVSAIDLPAIKIRVLNPFAEGINYGDIVLTLNGDGINRGCTKTRDLEGKLVLCGKSEDRLGGYKLEYGKNILEIRAVDKQKREYYASYVLILGDKATKPPASWQNGTPETFTGKKFAVILGVSEYKYNDAGLNSLNFADDDARAIAEFLRSPEGGGFLPANIKLLIDRDASLTALRSALNEMARQAGRNDLIVIFIAGHGAPDPLSSQNLYFLFYDTKVVDMEKTAYPMDELKRYLDTQVLAERVFVMIDTCHSAGINQKTQSIVTGRKLVHVGDENNISNFYLTKQLFKEKGRSIMTSSDVDEVSRESSKWGNHGVFTWALLEGLKGKADLNDDRVVTVGELFQFTRSSVQTATNFEQNPIALPGSATNVALSIVKKPQKGN